MEETYFHRVAKQSPTRLWINNPTRKEAELAIQAGAISCTTNPTYAMKMIQREGEEYTSGVIDPILLRIDDDNEAADCIQRGLVVPIMDAFLPLHQRNPKLEGFVSIQGNPYTDDNPAKIVEESLRYRALRPNVIVKIPAAAAGITAMEKLIRENVAIIATEVMSISQAVTVCEMYQRSTRQCGYQPPFYITHITGIFDEHLRNVVEREGIEISRDVLWQAGCIVARKQYRLLQERGYPGTMLGGGARGLHHFTEMVGGEMHITINWTGTADRLIETNVPVVYRMDTSAPQYVVDELLEKLPDFRKGYLEGELPLEEYYGYGPVQLFRSSFVKGWDFLLETIHDCRRQ